MTHAIISVINLRYALSLKGPVLDQFPLRLARTRKLHPRFTGAHSPPTVFTPWGCELELSSKKMTIQKKSQRYLTLFRLSVWHK